MSLLTDTAARISALAPAGFYIGLRVGFSFPAEELNRLPSAWVDYYTANGLVVHDPVMKWVYMNQGVARWSDIGEDDPMGVLESAAGLGLHFGAVASAVSPEGHGKRSYGNFLRADREFTDDELAQLADIVVELHQDGDQKLALTAAEIEALRFQAQGLRLKQIAAELNISMSAVKARLANAKRKLGARTPSQAASIAQTRGLR